MILDDVEDERRFADKNDTTEQELTSDDLDNVDAVSEENCREGNGDHGTGEDDAEGVGDSHEGDAGEAGDEGEGRHDALDDDQQLLLPTSWQKRFIPEHYNLSKTYYFKQYKSCHYLYRQIDVYVTV